jgi:hypothetical protein
MGLLVNLKMVDARNHLQKVLLAVELKAVEQYPPLLIYI